jgi:hypothetical protein
MRKRGGHDQHHMMTMLVLNKNNQSMLPSGMSHLRDASNLTQMDFVHSNCEVSAMQHNAKEFSLK